MSDVSQSLPEQCDVAIVGGGPAGLSAAIELMHTGVGDVRILERESEAGGIVRHCGHPPFGFREYRRIHTGPRYIKRLREDAIAHGVRIHTNTTVIRLIPGGTLELSTPSGTHSLHARRVLLCTGVRETPRSARLVSGERPMGVTTTGALQSMVYLTGRRPFLRPVIVGTELVAFSALLTCRHAGIRPVAMIDVHDRPTAWKYSSLLPMALNIPLRLGVRLHRIIGTHRVEGIEVMDKQGAVETLPCDGVVFSGRFLPEASLIRGSHLELDPHSGGPVIDQFGRCSDPHYFATGNLLRPVETAGWCWAEARATARHISADLSGHLADHASAIAIVPDHPLIKYVVPQRIAIADTTSGAVPKHRLQLRVTGRAKGTLRFTAGDRTLIEQRLSAIPERRILVDLTLTDDVSHTIKAGFSPA
jgi:thioredoxin reductase